MLERLTPTATEALRIAEHEAKSAGSPVAAGEHLALGLLAVRGVASVVLKQAGADFEALRRYTQKGRRGSPFVLAQKLGNVLRKSLGTDPPRYTENLGRVIALADEAARELGHPKVGTEHLLWALVEHCDGVARSYFESIDLSPEHARRQILEMLRVAKTALDDQGAVSTDRATQRRKTPLLDAFGKDLVRRARKNKLQRLVRRPAEADRLREVLLRMFDRNALIVGRAGCGKTALVQALAKEIALGATPEPLVGKRIIALDPILLVAGTKYRGQFEERITGLLAELQTVGDTILFLDDLHLLAAPGSAPVEDGGSAGVSDLLRLVTPALDRREVQIIATCASHAEARTLARFPVLEAMFERIAIDEPDRVTTLAILTKKKSDLEMHHRLRIEPSALPAAIEAALDDDSTRTLLVRSLDAIERAATRLRLDRELRGRSEDVLDARAIDATGHREPPTKSGPTAEHASLDQHESRGMGAHA